MEPAAKRARVEVAPFHQVDVQQLRLVQKGSTKNEQRVYTTMNGDMVRANLTPDSWLTLPFGFDFSGKYQKPSFLSSSPLEQPIRSESLSVKLNLDQAQAEFLQALDEAAHKAFSEIAPCHWHPLVDEGIYSTMKVFIVLKGEGLTKLGVVQDGQVFRGEGYSFLRKFDTNFRRAKVKLVVRVRNLWQMGERAGLSLAATQLILKPSEHAEQAEEADVFQDDDDLLA
jgi:hypothetical protein